MGRAFTRRKGSWHSGVAGTAYCSTGYIVLMGNLPASHVPCRLQIDVGEPEPRTIVSGLVKYVPLEQMQV